MATLTFEVVDLSTDPSGAGGGVASVTVSVAEGSVIHDLPTGGTTGQRLVKASDTDYDVEWVSGGGGGSTVTVDADGTVTVDGTDHELATDTQLAAEAVLARNADNLTSGTVADARIASTIARDSEVTAAASAAQAAAEATAAAALAAHTSDTTGVHGIADTADLILEGDSRLTDSRSPSGAAGGVLSGTYPNPGFAADMATQAELDAHVNDTTAAHAASAVAVTPTGAIASTDVQAALAELDAEKATTGSVTTVSGDLAAHLADNTDAHDASAISYAGSAGLSATDVEAALDELDTEKSGTGHTHTLDGLSDVDTSGVADGDALVYDSGSWVPGAGGGGGSVATDAIWDTKGDLAVGTGADTAAKLPAGANGKVLMAWDPVTHGMQWASVLLPLDLPPASPHSKDDEFNAASLDVKWTAPLTSATDQGVTVTMESSWMHFEPTTSGTSATNKRVFGIRQAAPTGSFTITAKVVSGNITGSALRVGAFVGIAGGKGHILGPFKADGQVGVIGVTTVSNTADWSDYDGYLNGVGGSPTLPYTWVKIIWNSGAGSLEFQWSQDGVRWRTGITRTGQSQPDQIGLAIYCNGGQTVANEYMACDWFRVTEP